MSDRVLRLAAFLGCVVILSSLPAAKAPASTQSAAGKWRRILTPSARYGESAVYDPVRRRMLVFGGHDGVRRLGQTWTLSLDGPATWSPLAVAGKTPSPRYTHAAVYDPVRDRLIVFGGDDDQPCGDVWELALAGTPTWSPLSPEGLGPGPRYRHSAIYDPARDRVVVFGGKDSTLLGDVWALSLAGTPAWLRLEPTGVSPTARYRHSAVYDPVRDRMIVFGGDDGSRRNDVWSLDLAASAWTRIGASGTAPSPRRNAVTVYDPLRDRLLVLGGHDGAFLADAWALSLSGQPAWTALAPAGTAPSGRRSHSGVYDPENDRIVIHGGEASDVLLHDDTWQLTLADEYWSQIASAGPLPYGGSFSSIYDPLRRRLVGFGYTNASWTLSLVGDALVRRPLQTLGTPPSHRKGQSMIYDPLRDRLVVFGGIENSTGAVLADAWELTLSATPTWRELRGWSPGLKNHDAFHIPAADRMVIVGEGRTLGCALTDPNVWTLLGSGRPDQPMLRGAAAYDPVRHRALFFGGTLWRSNTEVETNDLWALSLQTMAWSRITLGGPLPPARRAAAMIYDPVRDRMVLFGGSIAGQYFSDAWELSLTPGAMGWTELHPQGPGPSGRDFHSLVYDPVHDRMILFGGNSPGDRDDLWVLDWSEPVTPGCSSLGPVTITPETDTPVSFLLSNSLATDRTVRWSLDAGAPWQGFPIRGSAVVGRRASLRLDIPVRVPEFAEARHQLTLTTWFAGAEGNASSCTQELIIDRTTPVLTSLVSAEATSDRVQLEWQVAGDGEMRVERASTVGGWVEVGRATPRGGIVRFEDRSVAPGARYGYRLQTLDEAARASEVWVDVPLRPVLALLGTRPHPARGPLVVAFQLPASGVVRLELFDLSGRRLGVEDRSLDAGAHAVSPTVFQGLPPGVYVLRLGFAGQSLTRRAIVLE